MGGSMRSGNFSIAGLRIGAVGGLSSGSQRGVSRHQRPFCWGAARDGGNVAEK